MVKGFENVDMAIPLTRPVLVSAFFFSFLFFKLVFGILLYTLPPVPFLLYSSSSSRPFIFLLFHLSLPHTPFPWSKEREKHENQNWPRILPELISFHIIDFPSLSLPWRDWGFFCRGWDSVDQEEEEEDEDDDSQRRTCWRWWWWRIVVNRVVVPRLRPTR